MITVSASSVRLAFGIPAQIKWYPEDARFVILVLCVGAVVVVVAIAGFRRLAQFNEICAPWIFTMFFAGAVATLPALAADRGGSWHLDLQSFWQLANESIWVKRGDSQMGFWHVAAFAWVCNLAMHVGLSDMALLRFARHPAYGLYSACGMLLGHYLAWVCAGVMGAAVAVMIRIPLSHLDAGDVAYQALGISGALAVIFAGWSTSNPTLYRAGLALQAITPGWPRWLVTLIAGVFTTVVACFPFVFTKLLEFVGLYGVLLMPIGAIVVVEHYVFPKIGLARYWFEGTGKLINWPVLVSWFGAVGLACYLHFANILHLFFVPLPIWFLTGITYTVLSAMAGARRQTNAADGDAVREFVSIVAPDDKRPMDANSSWFVSAIGVIALVALIACFMLPIWVFLSDWTNYNKTLVNYRVWLTWASAIHLVACATWIIVKNK
jgi:NCS1 family nucleobase:cation symporter-1